jgi:MoxR-like ATPase
MEYILFSDYLTKFESLPEREQFWKTLVGNDELRLQGKVGLLNEGFCKINSPVSLDENNELKRMENPFEYKQFLSKVIGTAPVARELHRKNIIQNDVVFFSLEVVSGPIADGKDPIVIKRGSITKAKEIEQYYAALDIPAEDSFLFTDFSYDREKNIHYMSEDIEKKFEEIAEELNRKKKETAEEEKKLRQLMVLHKKNQKDQEIELEQLKKLKLDEIEEEKKNLKVLKSQYTKEKKKLEIELEDYKTEKTQFIESEIKELEKLKEQLSFFQFLSKEHGEQEALQQQKGKIFSDRIELLTYMQKFLLSNKEKPLYYDLNTLLQFYIGICTEQLVVLAGSPGTGKTSLVEGFAKATNAELRLIPVQPNWVDKSDLLGFYNPIEKTYVSTPFLDAILEAKKNEGKLFFICLDEMNLAHIEYYFAEFLSKLQTDRKIQLYSSNIKSEMEEELRARYGHFQKEVKEIGFDEYFAKASDPSLINYFTIKRQFRLLESYPDTLEIPNNIRFIGTINKDETTKDLSPKVVDRSFFIKVNSFDSEKMDAAQSKLEKDKNEYNTFISLSPYDIKPVSGKWEDRERVRIQRTKNNLSNYGIELTNRFDRTVSQILGLELVSPIQLFDIMNACLILPKVNVDSYEVDVFKLLEELSKNTGDDSDISKYILEKMKISDETTTTLTYWR